MAEQFDAVTPDIGAPDAGNPNGKYLDEGAGVPGTPILAGWKNTIKAFMERLMIRTGKAYNGNPDETSGISQIYDAFDEVTTGDDSALTEWAAGTYNQDDVVRHGGKQWFCGVASTIETPGPNSEWCKSKTFDKYLEMATEEGPVLGGFNPLNNIRDLTNYAAYFRMGKFDWNGGKWEAWAVHIDGSVHTSGTSDVAKLLALSKFSSKVVASDVAGTLTLKDYTELGVRSVGASLSGNVGDKQLDAMQRITGIASMSSSAGFEDGSASGVFSVDDDGKNNPSAAAVTGFGDLDFDSAGSTSPNTAKTDDNETRMANVAKGVWTLICIVPEGTI